MKNTKSLCGILALLLLSSDGHAGSHHILDEENVLEFSVSKNDHTRIAVKGDRILNVFGESNAYTLETDDTLGQIFIRPTKTISLTLTTEKGHTQDLRLIPKDKSSETVILEVEEETENLKRKEKGTLSKGTLSKDISAFSREDIASLLTACEENRIPLGYRQIPLSLKTLKKGNSPYLLVRELGGVDSLKEGASFVKDGLRGLVFEIKNTDSIPLILAGPESIMNGTIQLGDLKASDIVAVRHPTTVLKPGKGAQIYVVARTPL